MLKKNTKVIIEGKSTIDGVDVVAFLVSVDSTNPTNMVFSTRQLDPVAYKQHRVEVRADEAAFQDEAYAIQDSMLAAMEQ